MSIEAKDIVGVAKKQPVAFICSILVFALLVVYYFRMDAVSALEEVVEDRTTDLQKLKNNVTYSVGLDAQLKALENVNKLVRQSALRPGELAQNQQFFYRLEAETQVRLVDLRQQPQPSEKPPLPAYTTVGFSLTIEGEYRQILLFLKRLETGTVLARVTNAVASMGANKVPTVTLTVQMLGVRT